MVSGCGAVCGKPGRAVGRVSGEDVPGLFLIALGRLTHFRSRLLLPKVSLKDRPLSLLYICVADFIVIAML